MSTKPPPIFIVSGKSPLTSYGGGYGTIARNIAKSLTKLGYNISIIALGTAAGQQKTDFGTLVTVHVPFVPINISALPGLPVYSLLFAREIRNLMNQRNHKYAVVWGIGPWGLTGTILRHLFHMPITSITSYFTTAKHEWSGALAALRPSDYGVFTRVLYVFMYHILVPLFSIFDSITLTTSDRIVTNYRSTEKILEREFAISPAKFIRTSFPVQIYARSAQEPKGKHPLKLPVRYLLCLCRHDARKGINILLHAMAILSSKRKNLMPLVIGGTGQLYGANIALAKQLGITKWVTFTGFINDPRALMRRATIFCLPTFEEGAGALVVNEAMAMGLPIVTTATDGIVEDIEDGKSGLLVPAGDAAALADGLEKLILRPALRKKLGTGARRQFHKLYRPSRVARDMRSLLKHVMTIGTRGY